MCNVLMYLKYFGSNHFLNIKKTDEPLIETQSKNVVNHCDVNILYIRYLAAQVYFLNKMYVMKLPGNDPRKTFHQ